MMGQRTSDRAPHGTCCGQHIKLAGKAYRRENRQQRGSAFVAQRERGRALVLVRGELKGYDKGAGFTNFDRPLTHELDRVLIREALWPVVKPGRTA
jgi:hypothetical protein